jgi:hypothetical protein
MPDDKQTMLRKMWVPAVASIAGAGAGLAFTRKQNLGKSFPNLHVGDITDDLRKRLESVLNMSHSSSRSKSSDGSSVPRVNRDELQRRRNEREQRRQRRRVRA